MIWALHVKHFHAGKNNIFRSSIEYLHERSTKGKFHRIKLAFRNAAIFRATRQLGHTDMTSPNACTLHLHDFQSNVLVNNF